MQGLSNSIRGDEMKAVPLSGRRVVMSVSNVMVKKRQGGFTLIELVITITVLTIMTMGIIPLVKLSVKRQKEQQLRDALHEIHSAIDEFHHDTVNMPGVQQVSYVDPRSRVVISDATIFGVDNPDRYPPDLETLVNGVNVVQRMAAAIPGQQLSTKKKVYLRSIPIDPITGKAEWDLRSCYDSADSSSWGGENVFDVRSKSGDKAMNGEKYSDW